MAGDMIWERASVASMTRECNTLNINQFDHRH